MNPPTATAGARYRLLVGDVVERLRDLPAASVQTVVTSPPYWGLRDYNAAGQIGLEATPEEHTARIVEVFDEVARVLRPDGTAWVNYGDSYRDKQLIGMPWRVAFALQAAGWYLRSEIIWAKPNPMPESCTDRPTKSHEQLFFLAHPQSGGRYFYDADAVREPHKEPHRSTGKIEGRGTDAAVLDGSNAGFGLVGRVPRAYNQNGRNLRDVWTISTQAFPAAHFATFPEKLVEPCIKAGTSQRGACPECGAPWARVVEATESRGDWGRRDERIQDQARGLRGAEFYEKHERPKTTGWEPTCDHDGEPVPCTVLDPFAGSGTTLLVAMRLGCRAVGVEINPEYAEICRSRLKEEAEQARLF